MTACQTDPAGHNHRRSGFAINYEANTWPQTKHMATTISTVSTLIFQSSAFWAALGTTMGSNVRALPRLGMMLSINRTLRAELLEIPTAVVCRKRKRSVIVIANPRQSTFMTAVRSMLPYDNTSEQSDLQKVIQLD
jgi:hypothetical protein